MSKKDIAVYVTGMAIEAVEELGPVTTDLPTPIDTNAGKAAEALRMLKDAKATLELITE
jgi:hypothetical protein